MLVQEFSHFLILEGLPFHNVAPMTCRIPDTYENRFVFLPRPGESFFPPGEPVHRVELMLKEVRRLLPRQPVRMRVGREGRCVFHVCYPFRSSQFLLAG